MLVGAQVAMWLAPHSAPPTICPSCSPIGAIPFQINPHYLDANPEGHAGETREQRILEYIEANKQMWVVGLREGCMLRYVDGKLDLIGPRPMRIFHYGQEPYEVQAGDNLDFLLSK